MLLALLVNNEQEGKVTVLNRHGNEQLLYKAQTGEFDAILQGHISFPTPVIFHNDHVFSFLYLPASYTGEVYYANTGNVIYVGDDFYELCKCVDKLTLDKVTDSSFKEYNSRCPKEHTWVQEVKKCLPRTVYVLNNGSLEYREIGYKDLFFQNENEAYSFYKESLIHEVVSTAKGRCGVLMSGGVDSRLIAYILCDQKISFTAYTVCYKPYLDANVSDVERAKRICEFLNIPLKVVECDLEKYAVGEIDQFIEAMPSTSHLAVSFIELLKAAGEDGVETLYTGQNADALYCLGPTERVKFSFSGFSNVFKRICLSEMYFKTLEDVQEKRPLNLIWLKIPLTLGKLAYEKKIGIKTYYPRNSEEVIENFSNSGSKCTILSDTPLIKRTVSSKVRIKDIYRKLLNEKIYGYTKSGDSEAIRTAAKKYSHCNVIFPHSGEKMLQFYSQHTIKMKDVLYPKYFSYKYAKELARKYGKELADFNIAMTDHIYNKYECNILKQEEFYTNLLYGSNLGNSMRTKLHIENQSAKNASQLFGQYLAKYWKTIIIDKIETNSKKLCREDMK